MRLARHDMHLKMNSNMQTIPTFEWSGNVANELIGADGFQSLMNSALIRGWGGFWTAAFLACSDKYNSVMIKIKCN